MENVTFLKLTEQQLDTVKKCGENYVAPSMIPHIIEVDEELFLDEFSRRGSIVRKTYMTAFAKKNLEVNEMITSMSDAGSPAAVQEMMQGKKQCLDEIIR